MSETGSLAGTAARPGPALTRALAPASDAVELRLTSGDVRRIGTDDPQGLAAALKPHAPGGER
jgi:hypothetical protein